MALSGGMSLIKYVIFFFNLLLSILGLGIIIFGSWAYVEMNKYANWMDINFNFFPVILIVVGIIIFVVAFFGCCGSAKENHCMIMTFSLLLIGLLVIEVGVGVAAFLKHDDIEQSLTKGLNQAITKYGKDPPITKFFDMLQTDLHCCGAKSYKDWTTIPIPESCCAAGLKKEVNGKTEPCNEQSEYLHKNGCIQELVEFCQHKIYIIGGIGIGIGFIQLCGMLLACLLAFSIRKDYETV